MSRLADLACRIGRMMFEGFEAMGRSYLPVTPPPPSAVCGSDPPWLQPGPATAHPDRGRSTLSRRERRAWRKLAATLAATAPDTHGAAGSRPQPHPRKDSA